MSMLCASTYLYLLRFLSSVSYNFQSTGLLHPWLGLFPRYFIVLKQLWMVFFKMFLSVSLLLTYKNVIDFWLLILYPATMLNSFVSSSCFMVESLGFSMYSIMSSSNTVLLLPFQFGCLLFLLVWLLWLGLPVLWHPELISSLTYFNNVSLFW